MKAETIQEAINRIARSITSCCFSPVRRDGDGYRCTACGQAVKGVKNEYDGWAKITLDSRFGNAQSAMAEIAKGSKADSVAVISRSTDREKHFEGVQGS